MRNHINLLTVELCQRAMLRVRVLQWVGIWSVASVLGVLFGWGGYSDHISACAELEQIEREFHPIQILQAELVSMHSEAETLVKQEKTARELEDPRPALTLLGAVSNAAHKCQGRLQVVSFKLGQAGERGLGSGMKRGSQEHVLEIHGNAIAMDVVPHFIKVLREAGVFATIHLKDNKAETIQGHPLFVYQVDCAY